MSQTSDGVTAARSRRGDRTASRTLLLAVWGLLLAAVLAAGALRGPGGQTTAKAPGAAGSRVEMGRYLVTISGCNDCHTPLTMGPKGPASDLTRLLSGHPQALVMPAPPRLPAGAWQWVGAGTNTAFAGPWGISYAPNLTPDEDTGIGIWSEEMFFKAMRGGRHMGQSRPILPPMPWENVGKMTDEHLKAVFAYLRSIPAIHNRVPDSQPAPMPAPEPPPTP